MYNSIFLNHIKEIKYTNLFITWFLIIVGHLLLSDWRDQPIFSAKMYSTIHI